MSDPSRVMLAGDWHGSGQWAQKVIHHARKSGADAIVHVGDFGWWVDCVDTHKFLRFTQKNLEECGINLYWVDGNHEDHDRIQEWLEATDGQPWSDKRYPRITHMPRGYRWEWWGKTWLALGGAHSVDRLHRIPGRSWWEGEHLSDADIARAIDGGTVDIMVSHDCPSGVDIPGIHADEKLDASKSFWPASEIAAANIHRNRVRRVVDVVRPKMIVHGHYHVSYWSGYQYADGSRATVRGLDCDGSTLAAHTLLLDAQ